MSFLILDLWLFLFRPLLVVAFIACAAGIPILFLPGDEQHSVALACAVFIVPILVFAFLRAACVPWLWRFLARTRRFLAVSGHRIVLRYAPELHSAIDAQELLFLAENALAVLEARFGRLSVFWDGKAIGPVFRKRVHVCLFPRYQSVQAIFGKRFGGIALTQLHTVVIPFEGVRLEEWLKHELGHLFSDRWNAFAPPLFQEGLSTWLQGTDRGYTIDAMAVTLIRREEYHLRPVLDGQFFFREENHWAYYILAGSFTGFLIRRFGWDAYQRFYCRLAGKRRFDGSFHKHFSMTLEQAEELWREELLARYKVPFGERSG
jgi:hypothetical protein